MAPHMIGILWDEEIDWEGDEPFDMAVRNQDAVLLSGLGDEHGLGLYFARYTWYSDGRLEKAWHHDRGRWERVEDIPIDAVLDKFPYTAETKALKLEIEEDIGILNSPELERICKDKLLTYQLFSELIPETKTATVANAQFLLDQYGGIVLKPRYGAGGEGVEIVQDIDGFEEPDDPEEYVVQQYIELAGVPGIEDIDGTHDLRLCLIDGDVKNCYIRSDPDGMLANISQGGGDLTYVDPGALPSRVMDMLETVNRKLGDFSPALYTVDFVFDPDGRPWIIELNTKPPLGWSREIQDREQELPVIHGALDALGEIARTGR